MNMLFPLEFRLPEGFQYFPDFITETEELELISAVSNIPLHTFIFQGFEAKRRVASFGYDWNFETRKLSRGKEVPEQFHALINKTAAHLKIHAKEFAEVLLTEYPVGSVINWHRDAPPFDLIAGISLQTDCTFRFRPQDKTKQTRSSVISLPVQRRSLYIIQGASRTDWQHSILPVRQVRYSVTLRTLTKISSFI
jgi:alkylated DNA repair dioxygenase AlkB